MLLCKNLGLGKISYSAYGPCLKLFRGTRQGDSLSVHFFIVCSEVWLVRIRNDASVRGLKFDKIELELTSFANDVT